MRYKPNNKEDLEVIIKALNEYQYHWKITAKEVRLSSNLELKFKKFLFEQNRSEQKGINMSRDVMIYIIEEDKIIESYYLGQSGVYEYFPEGHFSQNAFLRLVIKFIHDIREGMITTYLDAWIDSDILTRPELESEIIDFITAHPNANYQIRWE